MSEEKVKQKISSLKSELAFYKEEYQKFKHKGQKIKCWLSTGNYKIKKTSDEAKIASCAVIANTIINTDAAITKR